MHDHFRLAKGVTDVDASFVFNNVAHRVINDAFEHARC
jgi:hypothetical protein